MGMVFCRGCGKEIHESAPTCPHCGAPQAGVASASPDLIPDGVKGWSWGAFLFNWIWAIGNKTWIGLLALVPLVGFIMAIVLGIKGREWAWKNKQWESVEHFNRVQRKWSNWGVGIAGGSLILGILVAIAIPAYSEYTKKANAAQAKVVQLDVLQEISGIWRADQDGAMVAINLGGARKFIEINGQAAPVKVVDIAENLVRLEANNDPAMGWFLIQIPDDNGTFHLLLGMPNGDTDTLSFVGNL